MISKSFKELSLVFKICLTIILIAFAFCAAAIFFTPCFSHLTDTTQILKANSHFCVCLCSVFAAIFLIVFSAIVICFGRVKKITYTDFVTKGNNLAKFKLDATALFTKSGAKGYSIAAIDIKKFKYYNEIFGYRCGDDFLKHIYYILNTSIKENELCARFFADWFVLLLKDSDQTIIVNRINEIFARLSNFQGTNNCKEYRAVLKCGLYIINSGENINQALDKAIIAKDTIADSYKSSYAFYNSSLRNLIISEKQLEDRMDFAIKNHEFTILMQPKYDLTSNKITGAEALVRWNHPHRGILLPADFIHIFERNGFILTLDRYVFEMVCKQIRWWIDNGYNPIPVSVNISRFDLYQSELVAAYKKISDKHRIPGEFIELELTETTIFENQKLLHKITNDFKNSGFSISIDDFGNGYSCLSLLGVIPFDIVKIDRRFLMGNFHTSNGRIVIKKVVDLVKSIKMKVVSEGVETKEQAEFLKEIGCDTVQGYYYSPPIAVDAFNALIK